MKIQGAFSQEKISQVFESQWEIVNTGVDLSKTFQKQTEILGSKGWW